VIKIRTTILKNDFKRNYKFYFNFPSFSFTVAHNYQRCPEDLHALHSGSKTAPTASKEKQLFSLEKTLIELGVSCILWNRGIT
jgi:hypothetical protein